MQILSGSIINLGQTAVYRDWFSIAFDYEKCSLSNIYFSIFSKIFVGGVGKTTNDGKHS